MKFLSPLHRVIDPHRTVEVQITSSLSDRVSTTEVPGYRLRQHFQALTEEGVPALESMDGVTCSAGCCVGKAVPLMHNHLFLRRVCAAKDAAGWLTLRRVEILDGD